MRALDFVESYIDAWNEHDAVHVAEHLTRDGVYRDIPGKRDHPREELITYLDDFFHHDHDRYELLGEVTTGESSIAFQYQACSRLARGEDIYWFGAEFVTLKGNQAVEICDYYKNPGTESSPSPETRKYARSGLTPDLLERYKRDLERLMREERVYLNSNLTLPKLSQLLHCPVNHLSQVINAGMGVNFFDYLNQYRIAEAKQLLGESDEHQRAILNVAFDVGFNSNSAFYAAFKKICGQTPAQYRKRTRSD